MKLRNIAIIAHVDHGKTTLVDGMLKQTHTFRDNQQEMNQVTILDSNDLEREKGITILAKNTAVIYKDTKINIIDTPGHSDFGGEVERVIRMADGALLIVDAAEGPLPQTQFVLGKALENNLKIIVVINKIDRTDAEPVKTLQKTEELFLHLAKHHDQLEFPVIYANGRSGKAWTTIPERSDAPGTLEPLFETILTSVPAPKEHNSAKPFKMLVSSLDFDSHKGVYAIGKIEQGTVKPGQSVLLMDENTNKGSFRINQVFTSIGLKRVEAETGETGDIIAVTGIEPAWIGQTLTDPGDPVGLPSISLEEPTMKVMISANTSPFSGREGKFCTARQLQERLMLEKRTNIGLKIEVADGGSSFAVSGRGEMHLSVLLETLRREGFEMQVGKPEVIEKTIDGVRNEPFEELTIEIDSGYIGIITEEMGKRKAELLDTFTNEKGVARLVYRISDRNLIGFRGEILTKTRGNGIFATRFIGYQPVTAKSEKFRNGVLVSTETGKSSGYALTYVQERGRPLVGPGINVYEGMVIGINSRYEDLDVNVCKTKKLTNIHSATADIAIKLDSPLNMSLEQFLGFIEEDELLEITPENLRLRKRYLTKLDRVRAGRQAS